MKEYDFIAIGGGSGGFNAARVARSYSDKVAVIDDAEELGGLCILRGCMPSKTLIYSAEVLHLAQRGKDFGLSIPEASVDMPTLHQRKLKTIKGFADYRVEAMTSDKYSLYRQRAKFVDPNTIELSDGERIRGRKFIIATGSHVSHPNIQGIDHPEIWSSDDVLDLDFVPETIIILGGGIVACECAQFLQRVGCHVIQIQRSAHILSDHAEDLSEVICRAFRDEGIDLRTCTALSAIERTPDGFSVRYIQDGEAKVAESRYLMNGLGRSPNTKNLGLEAAGVELKSNGQIRADEHQRTTNPNIYAAGDCAGPFEIVHIAVMQGEYAAHHAFGVKKSPLNYDHVMDVTFTDPQVARVGLSEKKLREREIDFVKAEYPFDDHGKSILMEAKYGFVRVFGEKPSGRILGAEIVSKDAGELIHALSVAVSNNLTASDLLRTHWYHPTLSEIISYPLEDIVDELATEN